MLAAFGFCANGEAGIAAGLAAAPGVSKSAGELDAKAIRSVWLRSAVCCGSAEASVTLPTGSRSFLASRFETGLLTGAEAMSARAAGTLSRPRMLMAAAPATRTQVSAMMVTTLVKQFSVLVGQTP